MLIAARNPCPCGNYGSKIKPCRCTPWRRRRYQQRLDQAVLDRIDLFFKTGDDLKSFVLEQDKSQKIKISTIKNKIKRAYQQQSERYHDLNLRYNSQLTGKQVQERIFLDKSCKKLLKKAARNLKLSNRAIFKVVKVARTIADLDHKQSLTQDHLLEALNYRHRPYTVN